MTKRGNGDDYLRRGSRLYGEAARRISTEGPTRRAEDVLAQSLPLLRSAMDWLEDTDDFEVAHVRLDSAGALQRTHFPRRCRLAFREGAYFRECPVLLAHSRVGFSVGAIIRESECSICHMDPDDCEHIAGRTYGGIECHRIITRFDLDEVSLVDRPNFPDARIQSASVDVAELRDRLGDAFEVGVDVSCDRCLAPCRGVTRRR